METIGNIHISVKMRNHLRAGCSTGCSTGLPYVKNAWQESGKWPLRVREMKKIYQNGDIFYFHPYLGKIPMLTNIFERG